MTVSTALKKSRKYSTILVEFKYGDPNDWEYVRYADWTTDVTVKDITYQAFPKLKLDLRRRTGTLKEDGPIIELPLIAGGFTDLISNGEPHSPIFVKTFELIQSSGVSDLITTFVGKVKKTIRNAQGKKGLVRVELYSWKELLDSPLGFTADAKCSLSLGDSICSAGGVVDIDELQYEATVSAIDGKSITIGTITPVSPAPAVPSGDGGTTYFRLGYCEYKGLRLNIRDWKKTAPTVVNLVKQAPAAWIGQTIRMIPGCDKLDKTCDERYGNIGQFHGIGLKMPNYHPIIEKK